MKLVPYESTCENADKAARGEIRVYRFGQMDSCKLTKTQLAEYQAAKVRHFVYQRGRAGKVTNAYYRWCEAAGVPYIKVHERRKYAGVSMDLIFLPAGKHRLATEAAREIQLLFHREATPRSWFSIGTYSHCEAVPRERAETVAAFLWAIATAPRLAPSDC